MTINKPSLLIVEDDLENQKFLRYLLSRKFDVDACDSAESFNQLFSKKDYEIILMDISLKGGKDGLQITRELRNTEKHKNIIIVGLSAHAFQKDKQNALQAGVDIFLTKPVQNDVLLKSLTTLYEEKTGKKIN